MVIKRFQHAVEKTMKVGKRKEASELENIPVDGDSPEASAMRGVKNFCESSGSVEAGDEVLHLPVIVDAAESSPQAAAAAALQIRKYLSKDHFTRPQVQYNAVMLIRILADNPGASFTKNIDTKFTQTVKELLRNSRDQSVQQIARETLSALYQEKAYDTNLSVLFAMWTKEVPNQPRPQQEQQPGGGPRTMNAPPFYSRQHSTSSGRRHTSDRQMRARESNGGIPPPAELAARVEEAKTSAKLLQQLVQSTSPAELQANDLIKEFSQRVSAAQRSIQGYIACDNPPPDEDTLQTLIETSEQLSLAASKHQRAVLQARRLLGPATPPVAPPRADGPNPAAPALPARNEYIDMPVQASGNVQTSPTQHWPGSPAFESSYVPPAGPPPRQRSNEDDEDDTLYNPPSAPSTAVRRNTDRQYPPTSLGSSVDANSPPVLPPTLVNRDPIEMPAGTRTPLHQVEDPFADEHVSSSFSQPARPGRLS